MNGKEIMELGFKQSPAIKYLIKLSNNYKNKKQAKNALKRIYNNPEKALEYPYGKEIYNSFYPPKKENYFNLEKNARKINVWGEEVGIDESTKNQMFIAAKLPIAYKGALLPDAHLGYGIPCGGVLATKNAVIPFGVGVDIGCRMALSIYDIDKSYLKGNKDKIKNVLEEQTAFGVNKSPKKILKDEVLDRNEFSEIKVVKDLHKTACEQIGSSGGGNHFVEFGLVSITREDNDFNLPVGDYIGILTHSGSRGLGANIARYYTKVAMEKCKLPKEAKHLAWLDMNSEEGQEYWIAMNLAGDYASSCHNHIHYKLAKAMGWKEVARVENHHNFAWKETYQGEEYIVHRKGATPAGEGVLGIIPGSMTSKGFIVRGKGKEDSLNSASHGSGRIMSRRKAKESFTFSQLKENLNQKDVELIGGGLDEAPMVYKDIEQVMNSQKDLVDILGSFTPKIVRMSSD